MSTPTKKPTKTRKTSQTARILESVELLIALHEEQESTRSESQKANLKVVDQLQQLEEKLSRISANDEPSFDATDPKPEILESLVAKLDSLDERLSSFEQRLKAPESNSDLKQQLQKMESSIVKTLDAKLAKQAKSLQQQSEKNGKPANNAEHQKLSETLLEQQKQLAENLDLISAQLEELQTNDASTELDSPSIADAIAQTLSSSLQETINETITQTQDDASEALAERLTESLGNAISDTVIGTLSETLTESIIAGLGDSLKTSVTDAFANSLEQSLPKQLESVLHTLDFNPPASNVEETSEQLELFTEHLEAKLSESTEQQSELHGKLLDRFSKIESHLTQIETQNVFQSEQESNSERLTREAVSKEVETQINSLKEHLESLLAGVKLDGDDRVSPVLDSEEFASAPEEDDEDSASHWHRQKKAMLQKYGIDPDYRPLEEEKKKKKAASVKLAKVDEKSDDKDSDSPTNDLGALHASIDNISQEDLEAVERLKKELNSKLRDAEIELSINRAKLSREKAELEQKATELEQRAAVLESKLAASKEDPESKKKGGLMSRFSRHLGKS